ncbi:MAG: EamA family transporter [Gammaproteobacteria bacterium]|nr:EamA family transporter [Gammaproteobacteria bacterium]
MPILDIFLCTLASFLWGINYIAIKIGVAAFSPIFAMFLRFIIVAILLIPWIKKTPKQHWWPLFKLAFIMGTVYFSFFFMGTAGVTAGEASIVMQLQVPIAAMISAFIFKEKLSFKVFTGITIAMLGVIVTIGTPDHAGSIKPIIYLLLAALFWAIGNIYAKRLGKIDPLIMNGVIALFAAPQLLVLSLIMEPNAFHSLWHSSWQAYASLLYMALISTVVCYSIWFRMLQKHAVSKVMPFGLLVPIVAVISADYLTGDAITLHVFVGCTLCVAGLALVLIKRRSGLQNLAPEES